MDWAEANGYTVFTHDLDFGTILALTHKSGPSVLQVRGQDVLPHHMGNLVIAAIRQHETDLENGALERELGTQHVVGGEGARPEKCCARQRSWLETSGLV